MVKMVKMNTYNFKIGDDVVSINAFDEKAATKSMVEKHFSKISNTGFFELIGESSLDIVQEEIQEIKEETAKNKDFNELKNWVLMEITSAHPNRAEITEKICKYIEKKYYIKTIRQDEKRELWIYQDGIWVPNGKCYIEEITRNVLLKSYSTHYLNIIFNKIMSDTFIDENLFFSNEDINLIPVQNGILNIATLKLEDFSPKYRFFNKINAVFDISKKCPNIIKHLETVLAHKDDLGVIQEMFGYCLLRDYKIEKAFMLTGSGRNGKGKTVDLLKRFLGAENCTNIPIQDFSNDSFATAGLHNKMANLGADLSATALKETGLFKSLTGRDLVSVNRKFKNRLSFVNYAKMIFCANTLPASPDDTEAFWNRWVLLQFPYTFLSENEYSNRSSKEKAMCKIADPNIIDKLLSEDEMSGLLNWSIKGLQNLLNSGDFSYSQSVEQVRDKWIRSSDSVMAFIMDCIKEVWDFDDVEQYETVKDVKSAYHDYCNKHKLQKENDRKFNTVFSKNLKTSRTRKIVLNSENQNSYINIWNNIKIEY